LPTQQQLAGGVKAMTMAAVGWTVSALLSVPQLGIYSVNVVDNKTVCESIFRHRPISHRQAYLASSLFHSGSHFAFSALTLLAGHQEEHLACNN